MKATILHSGFIALMLLSTFQLQGQNFNIYTGIGFAKSNYLELTPVNTTHPGYHLGMEIRLNEGKMYFLGGAEYHKLSYKGITGKDFFGHAENMTWLRGKMGLGFDFFSLTSYLVITGKLQGAIDFLTNIPAYPALDFNDASGGLHMGLGCRLMKRMTLQLGYEKGFFNIVRDVDSSKIDFYTLSIGLLF